MRPTTTAFILFCTIILTKLTYSGFKGAYTELVIKNASTASLLALDSSTNRPNCVLAGSGPDDVDRDFFCAKRAKCVPRDIRIRKSWGSSWLASQIISDGPQSSLAALDVIDAFTSSRSLSIVISQCEGELSWLRDLRCNPQLRVYIYIKCGSRIAENVNMNACINIVNLRAIESSGPGGTVQHFVYNNYHNLTDYTFFGKDTEQRTGRIYKQHTHTLRRLALGLLAMGHDGGFVHVAQDPLDFGFRYQKCGKGKNLRECSRHWWFRRMDERNSTDWLSKILSMLTGVSHFKRDVHFWSLVQNFRVNNETNRFGGFRRDERGFPLQADAIMSRRIQNFCSNFERLACVPCDNAWVPSRSQFIVSKARILSLPRAEFQLSNIAHINDVYWGILFNCFIRHAEHKESQYPFLRCRDAIS